MADSATPFLQIELPSTFEDVRTVLRQIDMRLITAGIPNDHRGTVQLVMAEALNNIVEHAYAEKPGPIYLEMETTQAGLSALISDRGKALPWKTVQIETSFPLPDPNHDLREGGFGWHIITTLATEVRYKRDMDMNRLWMMVPTPTPVRSRSGEARKAAKEAQRRAAQSSGA